MSIDKQPSQGFPCPECSMPIVTSIENLLSGAPVVCGRCALELHVDRERSAASLELVENLRRAMERAGRAMGPGGGPG
jgi:transcription elongation factor Elf1